MADEKLTFSQWLSRVISLNRGVVSPKFVKTELQLMKDRKKKRKLKLKQKKGGKV